jgi:hypothetical protein
MTTILLVSAISFLGGLILGYFLARLDAIYTLLREQASGLTVEQRQPTSFFAKQRKEREQAEVEEKIGKIAIDERKFVADINVDNIQKVTEVELGKTTTQQDNINQSVSKLARLKETNA